MIFSQKSWFFWHRELKGSFCGDADGLGWSDFISSEK